MLAQEVIRSKRDGGALDRTQIGAFVQGLTDGSWSEGQAAAMAMAIVLRGMTPAETVALTLAMARSGQTLAWTDLDPAGPIVDKHSTGGVGDKVSLMLAPILAACGAVVPMISGRGLGHTGGTLDKLEALPGYTVDPPRDTLLQTLRAAGCAIVGASADLAPADRRLYAIRDVTATVESVALITASILAKKLAAGLQALVLDVKVGSGAFTPDLAQARTLAHSLVDVARSAGLPARALISDMNQVLGHSAGNGLEVQEAIDYLSGARRDPRLHALTLALAAQALSSSGLVAGVDAGRALAERALDNGAAAERFERMVAALGGPTSALSDAALPAAPVQRDVLAPHAGTLQQVDVRALGMAVVALGGGRRRPDDRVDPRVGFSDVLALGRVVAAGEPLARVHAADEAGADAAAHALIAAVRIGAGDPPGPVVVETIGD